MMLGEQTMTAMIEDRQGLRLRHILRRFGLAVLATALIAPAAWAANSLQSIRHEAGSGGAVDVILDFAEPVGDVQAFTTDDPPRIALDLVDTANASGQRRVVIGSGATSSVTAIEADGRTRIVIDLFRSTGFESRVEGNRLIISVAGAAARSASSIAADLADPSKRLPSSLNLENIDFRRGEGGSGQLLLTFSGEGAQTDLRTQEGQLIVDLPNANLPPNLRQKLDVVDFATPVRSIDPSMTPSGAQLAITAVGAYDSMAYQTGNQYVVEVTPRRDADSGTPALGRLEKPVYSGKPVTFNFQDIPVRTVLQLIAEESGLNVVASDSVGGNVTLRLINVPWDQALDIVLRAKQLDKRQEGNVIWIGPQSELAEFEQRLEDARIALEERAEMITEFIPINYGSAEDIAKLLTDESLSNNQGGGGGSTTRAQGFLSPRGSVTFDTRTNSLLVNDIPQKVDEIKAIVSLLDRAVDQVLIEARIVIATESFSRELGARFGFSGIQDNSGNSLFTSGNLETNSQNSIDRAENTAENLELLREWQIARQTNPNLPAPVLNSGVINRGLNFNLPAQAAGAGRFALSIIGADYLLDLELSALQSEGRGEVVANPRVITANQQEAVIKQGDEVGFTTLQDAGGGGGVAGQFTVEFKEVLLELRVTPTITQDNRVFLNMLVKKDEVAGFVTTPLFSVPQLTKRELTTAVLVENGQTVVLGGVYEFETREDLSKIPFLGDIPGVGNFFRNKLRSNEKAELLVFVTPRILRLDELR